MVITRVTYYKCKAPPRTYHYVTLRDKVHLAHLWLGTSLAHLWGYSPYLNVFCAPTCLQDTGPAQTFCLMGEQHGYTLDKTQNGKTSSPFFYGSAPDLPL